MAGTAPRAAHALLIAALALSPAATTAEIAARALELTAEEHDGLAQLACRAKAESIEAWHRDMPPIEYAYVQCRPHSSQDGRTLSTFVQCSRPNAATVWQCQPPVPTVRIDAGDRFLSVRYQGVTTQRALDVVSYLLAGPKRGTLRVDPAWLQSIVLVASA